MIVPMKKIRMVVLESERVPALTALRKLGVVHVEKVPAASQDLSALQDTLNRVRQAMSVLGEVKGSGKPGGAAASGAPEQAEEILALRDRKASAAERISRITAELERLAPWGDVDPGSFRFLADAGIYLFPFEMSAAEFASLSESVCTVTLHRDRKNVRCVIVSPVDLLPESLPPGARPFVLPEKSSADLRRERAEAEQTVRETGRRIAELVSCMPVLAAEEKRLQKEIEFETVRAGMTEISLTGSASGEHPAAAGEDSAFTAPALASLSGFVPAEKAQVVLAAAKENGWACLSDDPSEEDNVPTQLKNNRFVNLISPLLDFLGTVPGYREIDISFWFLLFFGLFFAMIFGDGGYGLLLTLISVVGIAKTAKKGVPNVLYMLLYLSIMTVLWGVVTCTWFAIPADRLPPLLHKLAIPAFSSANPESSGNIQVFCFVLALVQLSIAHIVCMFRNIRSLKCLGDLGSLLMLVGMFFVVLNLVVDAEKYPLNSLVLAGIAAGFVLNFVFVNYDGSLGKAVLESLQNIISMLLGVVNVFGDIMSYIRLWAVALAGTAISNTVNQMAGPMLGGFLLFAGALILMFGHGLNLIMNVLSVIVHGVRLNILEFSNHISLTWSGFKYEPFSDTAEK